MYKSFNHSTKHTISPADTLSMHHVICIMKPAITVPHAPCHGPGFCLPMGTNKPYSDKGFSLSAGDLRGRITTLGSELITYLVFRKGANSTHWFAGKSPAGKPTPFC